jgi:hypothetical protein
VLQHPDRMMTRIPAALVITLMGCASEKQQERRPADAGRSSDSAVVIAVEDSVLDALLPGRTAVTRLGDTLVQVGGGMLGEEYAVSEYRKNGVTHVRIQRLLGNRPDGWPVWSTRTRIVLPAMDSTQYLLFAGPCGVAGTSDPNVIAIAAGKTDSVYREIRGAWRFEARSETLLPIATDSVTCQNPGEG